MGTPQHHPAPNIWAQMSYTPPRGPCSQKLSMLTTCPCHRFMIHPLKAPTSFECDGCGHHASFHHLSSREEEGEQGWKAARQQGTALIGGPHHLRMEEVMKWEMREEGRETLEAGGAKRRRIEGAPPLPPGERRAMVGAFGEEDGVGEDEVVEIGVEEAMRMAEARREEEVLEGEGREEAEKREEAERKAKGRKRKGR